MATAFLLRFQEECSSEEAPTPLLGTKTETKIYREGDGDQDYRSEDERVLTRAVEVTKTAEVEKESPDAHDDFAALNAFPRAVAGGTKTATAIGGETDDEDKDRSSPHVIPRSPVTAVGGTKTITEVNREPADDVDRERGFRAIPLSSTNAIPPCS